MQRRGRRLAQPRAAPRPARRERHDRERERGERRPAAVQRGGEGDSRRGGGGQPQTLTRGAAVPGESRQQAEDQRGEDGVRREAQAHRGPRRAHAMRGWAITSSTLCAPAARVARGTAPMLCRLRAAARRRGAPPP